MKPIRYQLIIAGMCSLTLVVPSRSPLAQTASSEAKQAVLAELTGKIDTKSAKAGDLISAKTMANLQLADGSNLPKGSRIEGKVTQVGSYAAGHGVATLAITFDQLEAKGSPSKPIHGVLIAIAPRPSISDAGDGGSLPTASTRGVGVTAAQTGLSSGGRSDSAPAALQPGSSVKGLQLDDKLASDGSAVLRSTDKDIRLENGMRIEVGLM